MKRIGSIELYYLGQSGFLIRYLNSGINVYIDPYKIRGGMPPASIMLITHPHGDHCSTDDINKVSNEKTIIVSSYGCSMNNVGCKEHIMVGPGEKIKAGELIIESFPAYNINKTYHVRSRDWLGFILDYQDKRIYHAGDTDLIPEMEKLDNINIALLPVSGTFVMSAEEAAEACNRFKPELAIPMHYGEIVGEIEDAERFKKKSPVPVEILNKE